MVDCLGKLILTEDMHMATQKRVEASNRTLTVRGRSALLRREHFDERLLPNASQLVGIPQPARSLHHKLL